MADQDVPAVEVNAADAAGDQVMGPRMDAAPVPDAPGVEARSPDQARGDDVPFVWDAAAEPAPVSPDVFFADVPRLGDTPIPWDDRDAAADAAVDTAIDAAAIDTHRDAVLDGEWPPQITYLGRTLTLAWCGDERMDWSQSISDRDAGGTGACAHTTLGQLIDQVRPPADAGDRFEGVSWGWYMSEDIQALRHGDGFRLVLVHTNGMPGMHNAIECYYFETNADCVPVRVGHFADRDVAFDCVGTPHWGYPMGRYCDPSWSGCHLDASAGVDTGQ